ncbi:MAG TPA: GFA family protein [Reyranellaceae bacterium]|nr:GFA family protein [Reyranellaceae bacterium]
MVTGRCLCGAVRWTATEAPRDVHHCHCGMCRRWTGAAFATLVWFARTAVRWEGEPVAFRSSPIAIRTHCGTCGTPLALAYDGRSDIALTAGSMDAPQSVTPDHHYGVEGRLPWADIGRDLPSKETQESW